LAQQLHIKSGHGDGELKTYKTFLLLVGSAALNTACGDISLEAVNRQDLSSLSLQSFSTLPEPKSITVPTHVVFFIDQSFSMVRQSCPQELDNPNEAEISSDGNIRNCLFTPGVDVEGTRFQLADKWMRELADHYQGDLQTASVRVAVIPYSGGKYQRPLRTEASRDFSFLSIQDGLNRLNVLSEEHRTDLSRARQNSEPLRLGTSVPLKTLQHTLAMVRTEMNGLRTLQQNKSTRLVFVYFSDGVFKATADIFNRGRRLSGCSGDANPSQCFSEYEQRFIESFGNPADNNIDQVAQIINTFSQLKSEYELASSEVNLLELYPQKTPPIDKDTVGVKNIYDAILAKVPEAKKYVVTSDDLPFSIVGGPGTESYRLEEFYLLNLNAHVNSLGQLVVDSDGDGLWDELEITNGTNPSLARSPAQVCSDGVKYLFGCREFSCDATLDEDGDGLNQCEEDTLISSSEKADSDGDRIFDSYEILRRLNVNLRDDTRSENGSAHSVRQMFFKGVHPKWDLANTPADWQIDFKIKAGPFVEKQNSQGQKYRVGSYHIHVANVPLLATQASPGWPLMKANPQAVLKVNPLLPGPQAAGENQIVLLAKIQAEENPSKSYWLVKTEKFQKTSGQQKINFVVDFEQFQILEAQ
jgi:hypothetical protein